MNSVLSEQIGFILEFDFPAMFDFRFFGLRVRFLFCAVTKYNYFQQFGRPNSTFSVPLYTCSARDALRTEVPFITIDVYGACVVVANLDVQNFKFKFSLFFLETAL
jgi:hypothetical protein